MQNFIEFGSIRLPYFLLVIIAAIFGGSFLLKRIKKINSDDSAWVDKYIPNALLTGLIFWKLSPLLFNFSSVKSNPMALLYLPGGTPGIILGVVAGLLYIGRLMLKERETLKRKAKLAGIYILLAAASGCTLFLLLTGLDYLEERSPTPPGQIAAESDHVVIAVGELAPDFSLQNLEGQSFTLSDTKGKWVVLNFWATWCPPCKAELPELKEFYNKINHEEIVFWGVNLYRSEKEPANLGNFILEESLSFPVPIDKNGTASDLYEVKSIPTTVVIDPDGIIQTIRQGAVTRQWLEGQIR